jgi:acyl-CoA thioesterase-1
MYEELAAKYGVPLVPFVMNGVLGNPDLISDDGVHPNAAGSRYIAETIWEYLEPMARLVAKGGTVEPSNQRTVEPTRPDTR